MIFCIAVEESSSSSSSEDVDEIEKEVAASQQHSDG